jgi:hypothetical protein
VAAAPHTPHELPPQDDRPLEQRACRECGVVFIITIAEGNRMADMTATALIQSLFDRPSAGHAELLRRVDALTRVVLDLLLEVEALREAQTANRNYRDAYRATCLLTHNSAGPSSGWEKLIECYYPYDKTADGRVWRESIMMRRLGFTPAECSEYEKDAREAETYT